MLFVELSKKLHLKTVGIIIMGFFLLYTCLGFFVVPYVAKKHVGKIIEEKFGVQSEIQKIYFNPFTFVVEVTNFKIPDRLDLGKLKLDLELYPLFHKQIKLKYIYLGDTNLLLSVLESGKTNWTPIDAKIPEERVA